ncbi:U3 snoRNA associated-domain-containing protein [Phyllosticta citrichinensis]|uniref:U3 snoRNA associated-domain-containing protein n=1 Tax=Phyllosticta citrichinensis TaxID=1130410 RepID=A0ABR1XZF4_9PEZI
MFSRVVHSARALLTRSPSKSSETPTAVSNDEAAAMVATRSGADTNSPLTNSASRSSRKRFQDDTPNGTPTRNNKKRKSSGGEQELETPKISLLARKEPQSTPNTQSTKTSEPSSETPRRVRGRPRKSDNSLLEQVVTPNQAEKKGKASAETPREKETSERQDGSQDDASIYGTPADDDDDDESIYATPATTLRPTLRGSARPTPASVTPKPRGRAARNTPSKPSRLISSQTIDEGEEEKDPKPEPSKEANKPRIIRFGSEDPPAVSEPAPEPPKKTEIPSSSADEDSDDEAPEAVTASSAREQARAAEEDATKAVKEQEAAAKRKRQEREARLREQAAASKRRKQKETESKLDPEDVSPSADVASSTTITASNPAALSKPAYNLQNIPDLLPDELLAAAPAVRPPTPEPAERGTGLGQKEGERKKLNKHLKFLDEKPAKDIKKGPVRLHVLEKGNKKLPPKVNNQSKNMRDQWLAGRRVQPAKGKKGFGGPERKKTGGGFLRN